MTLQSCITAGHNCDEGQRVLTPACGGTGTEEGKGSLITDQFAWRGKEIRLNKDTRR